jgi:hypothetical protein
MLASVLSDDRMVSFFMVGSVSSGFDALYLSLPGPRFLVRSGARGIYKDAKENYHIVTIQ